MAPIHWGILGCGDVTEVKSGPALYKCNDSELVAVMRRNGEKARDYAKRHGVPTWYDDAESLIHDSAVDAVYIATPPSSHAEYAIEAMNAGKPVYVEKPMALNAAECEQMIQTSEARGVALFVAYYRRCLPYFVTVKELLESGIIGKIRFVMVELYWPPAENETDPDHLHWHVLPEISGGGRFVDVGCHQLDFLDYVFGPIVSAQGQAANQAGYYPAEDIVSASFRFESGVIGSGLWCFIVSDAWTTDTMTIVGETGQLVFSGFTPDPIRVETAQGVKEYNAAWPEHVQQPLIQTVVDELHGRGTCPSTGISAARTTRVIDEILRDWRIKDAVNRKGVPE
jgi:predicted dehydrogenase